MRGKTQTIIITGFMGAGKTSVAAALARRLGCTMVDLDDRIAELEGRAPQVIIEEEGEPRFREIEARALRAVLENGKVSIIALGGGTWTLLRNRALINEHQFLTVWLDAPFQLCWQRITSDTGVRPLARELESARRLYDERRALYDQARLRIEVSAEKSAEMIAAEIEAALPGGLVEQTEQGKL
jgi:shikimate kinase